MGIWGSAPRAPVGLFLLQVWLRSSWNDAGAASPTEPTKATVTGPRALVREDSQGRVRRLFWTPVTHESLSHWNTSFSPSGPQLNWIFMKTLNLRSQMKPVRNLLHWHSWSPFPSVSVTRKATRKTGLGRLFSPKFPQCDHPPPNYTS